MSKTTGWIAVAVIACAAVAAGLFIFGGAPAGTAPRLASDAYPLYSGVSWQTAIPATTTWRTATSSFDVPGYEIFSVSATNITNIASVTAPFENYYRQKLAAAGWTTDVQMEAGGPGGSQTGYEKDGRYIVVGYATVFHSNVNGPNSPVACPCDTTLSVWSSSGSR